MYPVDALTVYIECTEANVTMYNPVFVALNNPSQSLLVNSVSNILNHAIHSVILGDRGYSAKNFKPKAATAVVQAT